MTIASTLAAACLSVAATALAAPAALAQVLPVGGETTVELGKADVGADGRASRCVQVTARKGQTLEVFARAKGATLALSVFPNDKCDGKALPGARTGVWPATAVVAPRDKLSVRVGQMFTFEGRPTFVLSVRERPTRLRSGELVAGALVEGDLRVKNDTYDCYAFDAAAGQTVRLTVKAQDAWRAAALHRGGACAGEPVGSVMAEVDREAATRPLAAGAGRWSVRVSGGGNGRYAVRLDLADAAGAPVQAVAALTEDLPPPTGETFADAAAAVDRGELAEAARIFRLNADQGDAAAALRLARLYEAGGPGVARDEAQARVFYAKSVRLDDDGVAELALAALHADGRGGPRDAAAAVRLWEAASRKGTGEAAHRLATAYRDGSGVARDPARARGLFDRALDRGYAPAGAALGALYAEGLGGPRDETRAADAFARGARLGDAEALKRLTRLAEAGSPAAQLRLGRRLLDLGGEADEARARAWLRKAADQGLADAEFDLGAALAARPAGAQERLEAYVRLGRAAAAAPKLAYAAELLRADLARTLPRDQLARADAPGAGGR